MAKGFYKWIVEIEIHPRWVADGFDLSEERVLDMLTSRGQLDHAYPHEYEAHIVKAPDPEEIKAEQGYDSKQSSRLCEGCGELPHDCQCNDS